MQRRTTRLALVLLAAAVAASGLGQETNLVVEWQASFGGSSFDSLKVLSQTSDGGYIAGGFSASDTNGNKSSPNYGWYDYWILRLDAGGSKLWERTFGGVDEDSLQSLQQTADGGFIAGGTSNSGTNGTRTSRNWGWFDFWILRLDANGNEVWQQSFGGDQIDSLAQVQELSGGGFILGGTSDSSTNGNKTAANFGGNDFWLVRVDASGAKLWDKSFGGSGDDTLTSICLDPAGGFLLGGYSASASGGNKTSVNLGDYDFWIVKVDANGNKLWERTFGGTGADRLFSMAKLPSGGFMAAGESWSAINGNKTSSNFGFNDFWVVRLDAGGTKVWDQSFGGFSNDRAWSVQPAPDGGAIVGGRSSSPTGGNKTSAPFGSADYWIVRIDGSGNKLWERAFGGTDYDELYSQHQTRDGGYILGGESRSTNGNKTSPNFGLNDFWVLKLSQGPYLLTLEVNDSERGSITVDPNPGPSGKYENGTLVTLSANANTGYGFRSWSGDVSGTNRSAQIVMDRDKHARASFMSLAPPVLACSPTSLTNFVALGQSASSQTLSVWNAGGSTLAYAVTSTVPWLAVTPATGTSTEETNLHTISFMSSNLVTGSHRGSLISSGSSLVQTVAVRLAVFPVPTNAWQKEFGGRDDDGLNSIISTRDGGLLLGGSSSSRQGANKTSPNLGSNDFWIVRLDAAGNPLWDKSFGGRNDDDLWSMLQTADDGFVLAGSSQSDADGNKTSASFGAADFWIVRVDANGNKLWDKTFGGSGFDALFSIVQVADGGFLLGGESSSLPGGNKTSSRYGASDFWIVRVDASGNKVWDQSFGGSSRDQLKAIQVLPDGGYLLAGESASAPGGTKTSQNFGSSDFWLVRLDAAAVKLWDKSFGGADSEILWALERTSDGGFILGGDSASEPSGNKASPHLGENDFWAVRLDVSGNVLWEHSFGGDAYETLGSLRLTADGGCLLAGGSASGNTGNKTTANFGDVDFWLVRLDVAGAKLWDLSFGTTGYDECYALNVMSDGSYTLGGASDAGIDGNKTVSNFGGFDIWALKMAPELIRLRGIPQTSSQLESHGYCFQLFGPTNFSYLTEFSTNATTWLTLRTNTMMTSPVEVTDLTATNSSGRIYRVRQDP